MKYNNKCHVKVRDLSDEFKTKVYPVLKLTEINIEYNGGVIFHKQYKDVINKLKALSESKKAYGPQLFLYMVNLAKDRNNAGFKVSLDHSLFAKKGKGAVSFQSWLDMLQAAVDNGYGVLYLGDSSTERVDSKFISVFELSDKAFSLLDNLDKNKSPDTSLPINKKESIQCTIKHQRGSVKWETSLEGVKGIRPFKNSINKLNEFLVGFTFKTEDGVVFDPQMTRKFSIYEKDGIEAPPIFDSYGRYINSVQNLPQARRRGITINGESTVEKDYTSNHAFICYEKMGVILPKGFRPYHVDEAKSPLTGTPEQNRSLYKMAMMMMFNSGNPTTSVVNELKNIYKKDNHGLQSVCPTAKEVGVVIKLLKEVNARITKYFAGVQAPYLQNIDSKIAEQVMIYLMERNCPWVCIHDSFLVPISKGHILREAMFSAWKTILGTNNCCGVDTK